MISEGLCSECTILAGQTGLAFEDGSRAGPDQGMYIHHILSVDLSKQAKMTVLPCDSDTWDPSKIPTVASPAAGFIGQGEDNGDQAILFTSIDGTYNSGFHVKGKDKFFVTVSFLVFHDILFALISAVSPT